MDPVDLPDAIRLLVDWLRQRPEVTVVVADRVYTEHPANKTFPYVIARRAASRPLATRPWWAEQVLADVSVYGGTHAQMMALAQTIRRLVGTEFTGRYALGSVAAVEVLSLSDAPDPDLPVLDDGRPRRRAVASFAVIVHPNPSTAVMVES